MNEYNFSYRKLIPPSFFKIDFVFICLVILSGLLVYFHNWFPDIDTWETDLFTFSPAASQTVQSFIYVVLVKLTPVLLFSIWYISDEHWWRYAITVPLGYLFFQFLSVLSNNLDWSVNNTLLELFPFIITYLLLLTLVQYKLKYRDKNLGITHGISADNLYMLPSSRQNSKRLIRIKNLIFQENIDRLKLNLIYREYDYLKRVERRLDNQMAKRNYNSRAFRTFKWYLEVLVFLFILLMPVIFNFHRLIERNQSSYDIGFLTITRNGFQDVHTLFWVLGTKLIIILPVTVWFFTSRYWWKYFLLIPFCVYVFQIIELFKSESPIDGIEFKLAFPIVAIILGAMIFFSLRLRKFVSLMEFYTVMEIKINESLKNLSLENVSEKKKNLKKELTALIKDHKKYAPSEYLERLKGIKKRLEELSKEQA